MYTFSGSKHLNVDNENMFPLSSIVQYVAYILQKHETQTPNQQKLVGVLRWVSSTTNVLRTSISSPCCGFGSCTFEHDTWTISFTTYLHTFNGSNFWMWIYNESASSLKYWLLINIHRTIVILDVNPITIIDMCILYIDTHIYICTYTCAYWLHRVTLTWPKKIHGPC
jgi:hypothetical protein